MSIVYWRAGALSPDSINTLLGRHDAVWPALVRRLAELRAAHRHSIRLVEAGRGSGALLIRAARLARALGFTAVEARAIDADPARMALARAAAAPAQDLAIGWSFDAADPLATMADERDFPADVLVWHAETSLLDPSVLAAADIVIVDPDASEMFHAAA